MSRRVDHTAAGSTLTSFEFTRSSAAAWPSRNPPLGTHWARVLFGRPGSYSYRSLHIAYAGLNRTVTYASIWNASTVTRILVPGMIHDSPV